MVGAFPDAERLSSISSAELSRLARKWRKQLKSAGLREDFAYWLRELIELSRQTAGDLQAALCAYRAATDGQRWMLASDVANVLVGNRCRGDRLHEWVASALSDLH